MEARLRREAVGLCRRRDGGGEGAPRSAGLEGDLLAASRRSLQRVRPRYGVHSG